MIERKLILRRKSNASIKATINVPHPTTVSIWQEAKKLSKVFGEKRYFFDVTEFAYLYPNLENNNGSCLDEQSQE